MLSTNKVLNITGIYYIYMYYIYSRVCESVTIFQNLHRFVKFVVAYIFIPRD